jgi:uncharacterized secreted repeat protein (TIGR03808 family)
MNVPSPHCRFSLARRRFLTGGAGLFASALLAAEALAGRDPVAGATAAFLRGCLDSSIRGEPFKLPAGAVTIYSSRLLDGARLVGTPGKTIIRNMQGQPAVFAENIDQVSIEGVIFDGGGVKPADPARGLLHFDTVGKFRLHGVTVRHAGGIGVSNRNSGGEVFGCAIRDIGDCGYFSLDSQGVVFGAPGDGNEVSDCGNNGVMIWTTRPWRHDGSRVENNRIARIAAASGGTGPYGNGVGAFRAADVRVRGNRIDRCAFSAVRFNSTKDVAAIDNVCADMGERAMYAEFDFRNADFIGNRITRAGGGIALANFDFTRNIGCGGSAVGNQISNLLDLAPYPQWTQDPVGSGAMVGIEAEGDIKVTGNTVVGPARIGVQCGYGAALRNLHCEGNLVRDSHYGVAFASHPPCGPATIVGNRLIDCKTARIVAMRFSEIVSGDLFGKASPHPRVTLGENFPD